MIFYLYGQDTFRSREKLRALKDKFLRDVDPSGRELLVLEGATMRPEDLRAAAGALSMFTRKRMIVVERVVEHGKAPVQEAVVAYLESAAPDEHILVFWEGAAKKPKRARKKKSTTKKITKKTSLHPLLLEREHVQEFTPLDPPALKRFIQSAVTRGGGAIESRAVARLAEIVGNDLWRCAGAIDKLIAAVDGLITTAAVDVHCVVKSESAIFALTDAIGVKNSGQALLLFERERAAGSAPLYILTMLARHFRILLHCSMAVASGVASHALASTLSLHPFVVKKSLAQLRHFSQKDLMDIQKNLLDCDLRMKTGRGDPDALLVLFIAETAK